MSSHEVVGNLPNNKQTRYPRFFSGGICIQLVLDLEFEVPTFNETKNKRQQTLSQKMSPFGDARKLAMVKNPYKNTNKKDIY